MIPKTISDKSIKNIVDKEFDPISEKIDKINNYYETEVGYKGTSYKEIVTDTIVTKGWYATEVIGIYLSKNYELATHFGENVFEVTYSNPLNPLIVHNERLPILHYDDDDTPIFFNEPIKENIEPFEEIAVFVNCYGEKTYIILNLN